jgi:dipeptidyl aminopeptidase/acylaminoacyl peptidase
MMPKRVVLTAVAVSLLLPAICFAQVTAADYERAAKLRDRFQGLAVNIPEAAKAIDNTHRFWYRKAVKGGNEFVLVDADASTKNPAFDHERLAVGLSKAANEKYTALTLPFTTIQFVDNAAAITFTAAGSNWKCELTDYACRKTGTPGQGQRGAPPAPPSPDINDESPSEFANNVEDGMTYVSPQQGQRGGGGAPQPQNNPKVSPDDKLEALILNFNVFLRPKGKTQPSEAWPLSYDGSEGNYYTLASIAWSPDSKHLVAYRVRPGYRREIHYVESSPTDQLQPKHSSRVYAKPGDALDMAQPVLFEIQTKKQLNIDNALFPNPYSLTNPVWRKDSHAFTFEYNQRGHQLYRIVEVNRTTGQTRAVITEESKTFINYRQLVNNPRDTGKKVRYEIGDGKEIIWMSERDGWAHLYLYDGETGRLKNQITKGNWLVRYVEKVDETKRQIWFQASGMYPGKDPYFTHYYRINFDGTGLTPLTEADANHAVSFSSDMTYYIDTYSRVDLAPVSELRRTSDNSVVLSLDKGDISALLAAGWRAPEVFTAMGRDGKTDIWGIISRPLNFDASKKYPVIESIYAGPQGSFVPKTFSTNVPALTELGFIVVQIDGMGTANRSKTFHEVAFKNLGDAGFPDRILWHKAVAAKYPYYDITRVGVYGTSAGGQNAMGGVLFHPEFYKAAVANSGCHDNRMDKIWWNEHWMSWPLGPQYAESSNVDNAYRLQGKLLLVVPEMDTNVDPASTYQVVNALIKANKKFDQLTVPGGNHGAGGAYYQRLLQDFFIHHLQGLEPPDWNSLPAAGTSQAARAGGQ